MTAQALFSVPPGATAQVSIIDSGFRLTDMPTGLLLTPEMDGLQKLPPIASWSFLVQSSKGQKILFDLGGPPAVDTLPPAIMRTVEQAAVTLKAAKQVTEILKDNGIESSDIESVIWSHHHFDHVGDIRTFPETTELVVGPGFKAEFLPGYPTLKDSELPESYFQGREIREIEFSEQNSIKIGAFRAYDFFGDGSFYLLDAPGHTVGHLAGLARTTTNPDTFIFMGGDLCHHGGEIRPSTHLSIPADVHFPIPTSLRSRISVCPGGALFQELNVKRGRRSDEPFFDPVLAIDVTQAIRTIKDAQVADAQSDVFFVFAHDMGIQGSVDFFPQSANDWKAKGWKDKTLWNFLEDLTLAVISPE